MNPLKLATHKCGVVVKLALMSCFGNNCSTSCAERLGLEWNSVQIIIGLRDRIKATTHGTESLAYTFYMPTKFAENYLLFTR